MMIVNFLFSVTIVTFFINPRFRYPSFTRPSFSNGGQTLANILIVRGLETAT